MTAPCHLFSRATAAIPIGSRPASRHDRDEEFPHEQDCRTVRDDRRRLLSHRFTLKTGQGTKLIDLGPDGERDLELEAGQNVEIRGEEKPGEVRASEIRIAAGEWRPVQAGGKPSAHGSKSTEAKAGGPDDAASWMSDEKIRQQLVAAGYGGHGDLVRKPKHVEVQAEKDGKRHTVHIHQDGVKKVEPVA